MINEQERADKIAMSEMKEKISMFLYKNFIDFERDKGVKIKETVLRPAFYLNKHGIIIECFKLADEQNDEFIQKASLYLEDGVKFLPLDLRVHANNNIDMALREQLPKLGCDINRFGGLTF